jgi:hypothetical protein
MSPQAAELLVEEIAPRIRSSMHGLAAIGAEDAEEQAQDAVALAARLLLSTEARGKKVTPGNIAYYAVGLVRQGRRSTGQSKTDPLHAATQLCGRSSVVSMDAMLSSETDGEETLCLHDMLAAPVDDPALSASRRLDWASLLQELDAVAVAVLVCLGTGEPLTSLVKRLKRSRSALQAAKERLASAVREHLGQDILKEIQELPLWRHNLVATRERSACRVQRQAPA